VPSVNTSDGMPDRRKDVRVDLLADLEGHLVTLDERIQVRQISLGGMTAETTAPLSPRLEHEFRLTIGDHAVTVRARVVHSRVAVQGDAVSFLAGVQFVEPTTEALGVIRELIDRLAAGDAG
jgi:c-di-GMP-binding flagellar brake protein YcgR